jgi:hypothetical protein
VNNHRCYICGAKPQLIDVTQLGDPEPQYMPGHWPPGDHTHALNPPAPPTPSDLQAQGDAALAQVRAQWSQ